MRIKLLIATHKQYHFPNDTIYEPIHVGKSLTHNDFGYLGDDSGENISSKNQNFCELTALYWAWKNDYFKNVAYCGLVHYRRYFKGALPFQKFFILSEEEIEHIFRTHDIILPRKRNYYIDTIYSHYANAHYVKDLDETRKILEDKYPGYLSEFDILMKQTKAHMFNMFIMKEEDYRLYCEWLFDILFELEKRVDISDYSPFQKRIFGFLSELLLNVWVAHQKLRVKEIPVVHLEGDNIFLKGISLIKRKLNLQNKI